RGENCPELRGCSAANDIFVRKNVAVVINVTDIGLWEELKLTWGRQQLCSCAIARSGKMGEPSNKSPRLASDDLAAPRSNFCGRLATQRTEWLFGHGEAQTQVMGDWQGAPGVSMGNADEWQDDDWKACQDRARGALWRNGKCCAGAGAE